MSEVTPAAPAAPPAQAPQGGVQPRDPPTGRFQSPAAKPEADAPPAETAAEKRIRLKLGDKEEDFDERTAAGLISRGRNAAQLMSKADKIRQEAERKAAEAEAKLSRLKADPFSVLRELGVDVRGMSEREIMAAIEEEKERALPPEEQALRRKAREADEYKRKLEEREKSEAQAREDAETEHHKEAFAGTFLKAMESTGLPPSSARAVMHRVASVYLAAVQAGEEVSPEEAASYAVEHLRAEHQAIVQGMSVPELVEWLGADMMNAIRRHDLEQYRKRKGTSAPAAAPVSTPKPPEKFQTRHGRWDFINATFIK